MTSILGYHLILLGAGALLLVLKATVAGGLYDPWAPGSGCIVRYRRSSLQPTVILGYILLSPFGKMSLVVTSSLGLGVSSVGSSHLSAITLFLGFHTLGLYVHNDVMQGLGTPELEISLSPVFGQWLQVAHGLMEVSLRSLSR